MTDLQKFRNAFKNAGFRQATSKPPLVFNDKRKSGIRRIKLHNGDHIFNAPGFAQEDLDREFGYQFGERYLGGQFIPCASPHWAIPVPAEKSFCIYLLA